LNVIGIVQAERENAMNGAKIYRTQSGWVYEVWFQGRIIVIGCRASLEAATRAAAGF
jgi:hypothetical protein